MIAATLLAGLAACGAVALRRAGAGLLASEQVLGGVLAGWMAGTWLLYALALVQGRLRAGAIAFVAVVVAITASFLMARELRGRSAVLASLLRRERVLVALLAIAAPILGWLYWTRMLLGVGGEVWAGGSAWGDMAMHAALAASFAHADNFPPQNLLFPPEPLQYPFLPDFLTAVSMAGGLSMHAALVVTALPLALVAVGLFFCLARRVTGSPAAAVVASALLWLNGGFGFLYFLEDWRTGGGSLADALSRLREDYCHMSELGLYWSNLVTDVLMPQRAALVGLPAVFLALIALAAWWRGPRDAAAHRLLLLAGVVVGALPRFHTHSYAAIGLVSGLLFLLRPSRDLLRFWVPAVALGFPQLVGVGGHAASSSFVHLQPGWLAGTEPQVLFWLRNVGPTLVLAPIAWWQAERPWRRFYLALLALQVFASIVMLTPNAWDNIKLMYVWYAFTCVLVGGWLVRLASGQRALAAGLVVASIASGLLALQHERLSRHRMFSGDEVAAAAWARERIGPREVVAAAPSHLQPLASLAGRPTVLGYTGWMWTHGYDYQPRVDDLREIFRAGPELRALLDRYEIRWLYVGPRERQEMMADERALAALFPVAFRHGDVAVYAVEPLP